MQIFQYAMFFEPTPEQEKAGRRHELVGEVKTILAKSQAHAQVIAARSIDEKYIDELDQITIVLRPF